MRRVELLIDQIRMSTESQHEDGNTDSISNVEILQCLNDGQDSVYAAIVNSYSNFYLTTGTIDLVSEQQSYTLPSDMYLGSKIKKVEYLYGGGTNKYTPVRAGTEFDLRTDYESAWPSYYCRGYQTLKISPLPSVSLTDGLRVTYTRKIRRLDVRRGIISSASKTGSTLNTITLDLTPALGKDSGTVAAARDLLNKVDYICVVDSDGAAVVETIPVDSYNSSTGVITVRSGFTTTVAASSFANQYVVAGSYSTTHSELPEFCEAYLIQYAQWKILRRNGNQPEASSALAELADTKRTILESFANPDDDVHRLHTDELWGSE